MISYIRNGMHNLSIKKKLLFSFFSICTICFAAMFCVGIPLITKGSKKNVLYSANQALEQAQEFIAYRMDNLRQTSYAVAYDDTIINIIATDSSAYPLQQQMIDQNTIGAFLRKTLISHHKTISNISLYLNDRFSYVSHSANICRPYSMVMEQKWYDAMQKTNRAYYYIPPVWCDSPKMVSVVHMISNPNDYSEYIGAVILDTPVEGIRNILKQCAVTTNSYTYLINDEGIVVATSDDSTSTLVMSPGDFQTALSMDGPFTDDENLYFLGRMASCGWTLVQVIPNRDIWEISFSSLRYFLIICMLVLLISITLSLRLSSGITKRLHKLSTAMRCFRYEKAEPFEVVESGDDIDYLMASYNQLISELDQLTAENIQKGQIISETELALLHSQIKPHFLYNTLDMIRALADTGQAEKVSAAMRSLSSFYRSGLGNHTIWSTLHNEINHILSYMEIQKLRFGDQVTLEIQIPEEYMDINLPRITLQPIVENALIHGILGQEKKIGVITIHAETDNKTDLLLVIRDNGCGMSQERLVTLFQSERFGNGIGLWNTNERIRIHYGSNYGLSVNSQENEYTEIRIRIPVLRGKEIHNGNIDS